MLNEDELYNGAIEKPEGLYIQRKMTWGERGTIIFCIIAFITIVSMAMQSDFFWKLVTGQL